MSVGTLIDAMLKRSQELQIKLVGVEFEDNKHNIVVVKWRLGNQWWQTSIGEEAMAVHGAATFEVYCQRAHHALTRSHMNKRREKQEEA